MHVWVEVGVLHTGDDMFKAIKKTLDSCYAEALALVRKHLQSIERVGEALLRGRYLEAEEVQTICDT